MAGPRKQAAHLFRKLHPDDLETLIRLAETMLTAAPFIVVSTGQRTLAVEGPGCFGHASALLVDLAEQFQAGTGAAAPSQQSGRHSGQASGSDAGAVPPFVAGSDVSIH